MIKRHTRLIVLAAALPLAAISHAASAQASRPALVITNDQIPANLKDKLYGSPVRSPDITPEQVLGTDYYQPTTTIVSDKIRDLENQLSALQGSVATLMSSVNDLQQGNEKKAAAYYADVATISTQLQTGTTKGNPRLESRMKQAQNNLENLGASVNALNNLAADAAAKASEASYLQEATRSAYTLSGAVEEDHVHLAQLEDAVNSTSVMIERLLYNVNDDITRTSTYLSSERNNLRTLALAVDNGDLYGKSLSDRPFSSVGLYQQSSASGDMASMGGAQNASLSSAPQQSMQPMAQLPATQPIQQASAAMPSGPRPLVKIRFDRADVDYEQPVYMAVNEALRRYPNASFDLVAVTPTQGNAAEVAIESTKARRNAEKVLRSLTQMGLPLDRVNLSYQQSAEAKTNEVHLYVR